MLPIPFNSAELATALPDVIAATGIAFVLAFVIFKPRSAPTPEAAIETLPPGGTQTTTPSHPSRLSARCTAATPTHFDLLTSASQNQFSPDSTVAELVPPSAAIRFRRICSASGGS